MLPVLLFWLLQALSGAHGRICPGLEVRNCNAARLKGCSIIDGNLYVILCENGLDGSFPDLVEVRGFVLVYRVNGVRSLGKLFPNLSIVRGQELFMNYAFTVVNAYDLQEIGLKHLQLIENGYIRIENCRNVCHYNYLPHIFGEHAVHVINHNDSACACPEECKDGCISDNACFKMPDCHEQCIGCTGPGPTNCLACKYVRNGKECVSKCPIKKYANLYTGQCVTKEECFALSKKYTDKEFFIYKESCLHECPPKYEIKTDEMGNKHCKACSKRCRKDCEGRNVTYLNSIISLKHCTHIIGNLSISNVKSSLLAKEVYKSFKDIEVITDFLKIERSDAFRNLEFLPNLREIQGHVLERDVYVIYLFENKNLEYLWNWTRAENNDRNFTVGLDTMAFFGNSQLCNTEIHVFGELVNNPKIMATNNKEDCKVINIGLKVVRREPTKVKLKWNAYQAKEKNVVTVGYLIYYMTTADYNLTLELNPLEEDKCSSPSWGSIYVQNTTAVISKLKPFTEYTYYVNAYTTSKKYPGGRTIYMNFTTLADKPSDPIHVKTTSNASDSIYITWKPPTTPNGILHHYQFRILVEKDDPRFIDRRNYCKNKITPGSTSIAAEIIKKRGKKENESCGQFCKREAQEIEFDEQFGSLCGSMFDPGSDHYKEKVLNCKKRMASPFKNADEYEYKEDDEDDFEEIEEDVDELPKYRGSIINETLPANKTSFHVKNLQPYTLYVIYMQACNKEIVTAKGKVKKLCSEEVMAWQKTVKNATGDQIPGGLKIDASADGTVVVKWPKPLNPNGVIVSYEIEYRRTDKEHAIIQHNCTTRIDYEKNNQVVFTKMEGEYEIRVQAVTIAGPGPFTEFHKFQIPIIKQNWDIVIVCVLLLSLVLFVAAGLMYYLRIKRRHRRFDDLLIRDVNPDYAGPIYVEDEWEVDRSDVIIRNELGQGSFGMVYSGFLQSRGIECAIKTVNDGASFHDRMEFLNEAGVMKGFHDAHHVVKLFGVVSRGDPPLVVMELMERGDLKTFLRRSRESSHNITSVEMFQMAIEIADGMAYLAGKKYVHRDLAARNCMVAADHTVKIGDFGMARDIYETDYYRKESRGLLPVRWMAPESLADGVFTSDSDVWSYGVVLWEMATLAMQPYQGLSNEQVLQYVVSKGTLSRPVECPEPFWQLMEMCWRWKPNSRPMFIHIVERLNLHVSEVFQLVSYYHTKTTEELRQMAKDRVYNPPAVATRIAGSQVVWRQVREEDDNDRSGFYGESSRQANLDPYQRHRPPTVEQNFLGEQLDAEEQ